MSVNRVLSDGSTQLLAGATLWADLGVGCIVPFGGDTSKIMAGWLLCDGTELTKTEYAELYAVIGDSFGTASVNTKFVLPDLREATTKGVGTTTRTVGAHKAIALGEFIDDRMQEHTHMAPASASGGSTYFGFASRNAATISNEVPTSGAQTNIRKGDTNEVKAVGVNFIIKAKQVALPADLESAVEDAMNGTLLGSVTADGTKTFRQLLNQLRDTVLSWDRTRNYIFTIDYGTITVYAYCRGIQDNQVSFVDTNIGGASPALEVNWFLIANDNSKYLSYVGGTITDQSTTVPTSGIKFNVYQIAR